MGFEKIPILDIGDHMKTDVALPSFNFSSLRERIRKQKGWGKNRISRTELEYQRFLAMCKQHPEQKICPSVDVDEMWHLHILDTEQYAKDCADYFGYFLHHEPCLNGNENSVKTNTIRLYQQMFGRTRSSQDVEMATTCANPGDGCGSRTQQAAV